jgi:hypothetical protein
MASFCGSLLRRTARFLLGRAQGLSSSATGEIVSFRVSSFDFPLKTSCAAGMDVLLFHRADEATGVEVKLGRSGFKNSSSKLFEQCSVGPSRFIGR